MPETLQLGDITVDVLKKNIKNVHLSVYPPAGRVRISAPLRMNLDTIRVFAISKLGWIKKQQKKIREQERETPREYLERESHFVWGKRYLLKVVEAEAAPVVELRHNALLLQIRPRTDDAKRQAIIAQWYREQLKKAVPALISKWEPQLDVRVNRFFVQHMKTRWGTCNTVTGTIRINTELAKKPPQCLEYIVVHEMVHLLERRHNDRFRELMDQHLPHWRQYRAELNRAPLSHESWEY